MAILSIAANEWSRLFLSKRGWLSIVTFLLIWALFLFYIIEPAARYVGSAEAGGLIGMLAERIGFSSLGRWESIEIALYWVFALYLLPFFTIVTAADQIASDKERGTMRFLVLRTSRTNIFFGRFLGQFLVQILMVLVTILTVLGLVAYNASDNLPFAMAEVPFVVLNLVLVLLPYVALMALMSVLAKSARQATLFAIVGWILLWILLGVVQSKFGPLPVLDWVLPGSQLGTLVKLHGADTTALMPIPIVHTLLLLGLGWFAITRSDL